MQGVERAMLHLGCGTLLQEPHLDVTGVGIALIGDQMR